MTGKGLSGIKTVCGVLGKRSMTTKTYYKYKAYMEKLGEEKYSEIQDRVVKVIFEYYKKIGIHPDDNGVLNIEVIFDGTWMTRGHSSLIGAGIVSEAYTGYILDGEILSKYCNGCVHYSSQKKKKKR